MNISREERERREQEAREQVAFFDRFFNPNELEVHLARKSRFRGLRPKRLTPRERKQFHRNHLQEAWLEKKRLPPKQRRKAWQDLRAEAFRRQFVDYRTLWMPVQTERLMNGIRADLEAEFGELNEEEDFDPSSFSWVAGYPYTAGSVHTTGFPYTPRRDCRVVRTKLEPPAVALYVEPPTWTRAPTEPLCELTEDVIEQIGKVQAERDPFPRVRPRVPYEERVILTRRERRLADEQAALRHAMIPTRRERRAWLAALKTTETT